MELQVLSNGHCNPSPDQTPEIGYDALDDEFLPDRSNGQIETQFTDFKETTSFKMSVFNLSNAIMGSGILGLAYAMANTGIILFVILLTCMGLLAAYSIHLLLKSAGVVGIRSYEHLGSHAFGLRGKISAACIIILHNIGAMSSFLFIVKIELPRIIRGLMDLPDSSHYWYIDGRFLMIVISIIIILPLTLCRRLGCLGNTSGFSLICMVFFLISVIYKFAEKCIERQGELSNNVTVLNGSTHNTTTQIQKAEIITFNLQTAYTIPIIACTFSCHAEVLPIYAELKKPSRKRMQNVANLSILAMFVMYLLTAIFGYLTFYGAVQSELLQTYSTRDPLMLCVRLAVLVAVTLTVPVILFPIRRAVLQLLFPDQPFHWLRHISIAVVLLFAVNLLVIFVPNIRDIFGFIGATFSPSLIFILPGIFYIRIVPEEQEPLKSWPKIKAIAFVTLGFIFMFISIIFIIIQWITGKNTTGGH